MIKGDKQINWHENQQNDNVFSQKITSRIHDSFFLTDFLLDLASIVAYLAVPS